MQKYLKEQKGCDKFAVVGFCWGGGVALTLACAHLHHFARPILPVIHLHAVPDAITLRTCTLR